MTYADDRRSEAVFAAAANLVARYNSGDRDSYLACFTPDATFDFHFEEQGCNSLADMIKLLERLDAEGARIISCTSTNQSVQILTGAYSAVFRHDVDTVEVDGDGTESTHYERETIVFQLHSGGRWLAVHEHLSPRPKPSA